MRRSIPRDLRDPVVVGFRKLRMKEDNARTPRDRDGDGDGKKKKKMMMKTATTTTTKTQKSKRPRRNEQTADHDLAASSPSKASSSLQAEKGRKNVNSILFSRDRLMESPDRTTGRRDGEEAATAAKLDGSKGKSSGEGSSSSASVMGFAMWAFGRRPSQQGEGASTKRGPVRSISTPSFIVRGAGKAKVAAGENAKDAKKDGSDEKPDAGIARVHPPPADSGFQSKMATPPPQSPKRTAQATAIDPFLDHHESKVENHSSSSFTVFDDSFGLDGHHPSFATDGASSNISSSSSNGGLPIDSHPSFTFEDVYDSHPSIFVEEEEGPLGSGMIYNAERVLTMPCLHQQIMEARWDALLKARECSLMDEWAAPIPVSKTEINATVGDEWTPRHRIQSILLPPTNHPLSATTLPQPKRSNTLLPTPPQPLRFNTNNPTPPKPRKPRRAFSLSTLLFKPPTMPTIQTAQPSQPPLLPSLPPRRKPNGPRPTPPRSRSGSSCSNVSSLAEEISAMPVDGGVDGDMVVRGLSSRVVYGGRPGGLPCWETGK
ncbi:hypothetical protein HDU97_002983 [Phlyctochytrium planicorne]|nr:hypothetical protein HDU97_002983 [Phlyctochytrium planicorne]